MIVLDSSVIVALIQGEPEAGAFMRRIDSEKASALSVPNYLEASNVIEGRFGAPGRSQFEALISDLSGFGLDLIAFDIEMGDIAREAFRRYGKGRHPAGLNLGDCFAYALAKALDAPLLYKGVDFDKTDLRSA